MRRIIARRVLFALLVCYVFLSGVFFGLALTDDPTSPLGGERNTGRYGYVHGEPEAGGDVPLADRYVQWLTWYATLDLGESVIFAERDPDTGEIRPSPVKSVLAESLPVTAVYLIPAVVLASVSSLAVGTAAALRPDGLLNEAVSWVSNLGIGLPAVVTANLAAFAVGELSWYPGFEPGRGVMAPGNLVALAVPAAIVALNLGAAQLQAARGETRAYVSRQFVKTLRAGGAGRLRLARHVLRNAAPALLALFVAEALLTLIVSVYVVEVAFGLPGFGLVSYQAFFKPDIALIVPAVMIPVLLGIAGSTVQDLATGWLDPRA